MKWNLTRGISKVSTLRITYIKFREAEERVDLTGHNDGFPVHGD
jgi:hypothetical protein